ncbi:MAG: response regulator transcription factor [Anaerolineae bacterium]
MAELIRALVVDDEERVRYVLEETLRRVGHVVVTASSGEEALDLLRDTSFDVAVVDLKLGGHVDGLRVLEALRWRWPGTAVVILTAHGSLESALAAIREGVDAYLLKPSKPAEVRQAVQEALERRKDLRGQAEGTEGHVIRCGGFSVDLEQLLATRDGQPLNLTPQELQLLAHLMQNAPRVVPPLELVQAVRECELEDPYEARQIIKWYIHRLRRQVEPNPSTPRHILNVRGVGYRFKD